LHVSTTFFATRRSDRHLPIERLRKARDLVQIESAAWFHRLRSAHDFDAKDHEDRVYRSVAYVMRYSKGGVRYETAMSMDMRRLRRIERALSALVDEEVEAAKATSSRQTERDEALDD
jgi:hypothetical protein